MSEIASRLAGCLRPDDILARVTGAKFGVIQPALVSVGQAILAANKILRHTAMPLEINGKSVAIKICIGVAVCPDHAHTANDLISCAECALWNAGASADRYSVYAKTGEDEISAAVLLEPELDSAIENGEIEVHFQPKIDLRTGRMTGVEALARWTSATYGFVNPDVFVSLAERVGLIFPLTLLTVNVALRQLEELQRTCGRLSAAINLSAAMLHDDGTAELVKRALSIWSIEPELVILEVTESAMMENPLAARKILQQLRDMGVRISIDDFGTGYSSLAYLKDLPVHELKIDRSFVMNMTENESDAKIVKSIIDLAHNFDLNVVAEGIETQETLDTLSSMGCDIAQGFYMARPMPMKGLLGWMEESHWVSGAQDQGDADASQNELASRKRSA